jgi:hypothetical protein
MRVERVVIEWMAFAAFAAFVAFVAFVAVQHQMTHYLVPFGEMVGIILALGDLPYLVLMA